MKPKSGLFFEVLFLVLFPGKMDSISQIISNPSCCRNAKKYYEKKGQAEQPDAMNHKLPKQKKESEKVPKKSKKEKKSKKDK